MTLKQITEIAPFLAPKVREDESGCWLWTASLTSNGYAQVIRKGIGRKQAHRFTYELAAGAIPAGLVLDHLCRTTNCVNPAHLEPVTQAENVKRGMVSEASSSRAAAITHCRRGHEYTTENTVIQSPSGSRCCRTCRQAKNIGPRPLVTHCRNGHEYSPQNTYTDKATGKRYCRECGRLRGIARCQA